MRSCVVATLLVFASGCAPLDIPEHNRKAAMEEYQNCLTFFRTERGNTMKYPDPLYVCQNAKRHVERTGQPSGYRSVVQ